MIPVTQSSMIDNIDNADNSSTNNEASTSILLSNAHQELRKNFSGNWLFVIRFRIDCGLKMI
ncbi:hypothetical protein V1477_016659 [Vespula maculifrons]|uniref:Uncharacterized protein n=1 Tax=Vespula maculifrons TaxID=7453 RepID=A0ABD2B406_VESMC